MDQLTQLYKSRVEDLQKQIIILESKLKNIDNLNEAKQDKKSTPIIERGGKRYIQFPDGTEIEYKDPNAGAMGYKPVTKEGLVVGAGEGIANVFADAPAYITVPVAAAATAAATLGAAKTIEALPRIRYAFPKARVEQSKLEAEAGTAQARRTTAEIEAQHAPSYYEGQARQAAGRGAEAEAIGTEAPARAEAERLRQQALADEALQRAAQTEAQEQAITAQEQAKARSEQAKAAKGQVGAKDIADKAKVTALENELDLARARARLQKPGQIPSGPYRNQPGYQDPDTGWWFTKSPDSPRAAREMTQTSIENLGAREMPRGARVTSGGAIALEPQDPMQELLLRAKEGIEMTGKDVKAAGAALRRGATTPLPGSSSSLASGAAKMGAGVVGALAGEYLLKPELEKAGVFNATEKGTRKALESMPAWAAQIADPALGAAQFILNPPVGEMLVQGAQLQAQKEFERAIQAGRPSAVRVRGPKF
jgi:hypothetical protein